MAGKTARRPRRATNAGRARADGGRAGPRSAAGAATTVQGNTTAQGAELVWLDPRVIVWPEVRITSQYREGEADALAKSLEGVGQQQPIGVYLVEGQHVGADGMNRCLRAIERGETSVLCVVREGSSADVLQSNIATALLRGHTNPLTVVKTLWAAYHDEGMEIGDLAMSAGRTVEWVERMLLIATASPAVKQALGEEIIAQGHAEALAEVEDQAKQEEALRLVLLHRWTVGELQEHLAGKTPGEEEREAPTKEGAKAPRVPRACMVCHQVQEIGGVQSMLMCAGCAARLGSAGKDAALAAAVREAAVLLREAESALASSPGSVALAEVIGRLVELASDGEGSDG